MRKTVSVVMCTYNGAKYIREQLDSIINQTYPIHELIIQDDCSTDETMDIVREYEARYPFIKTLVNPVNLGYNKNFEDACMRSTGDYVAISDQDDVWYDDKIEKLVASIGNHDICFCCHHRGQSRADSVVVRSQYSLEALLFICFAGHLMLLRGDFVRRREMWMDYISYDWSLGVQAQLGNGIVRVDEPLNWHRTHDEEAGRKEHKQLSTVSGRYKPWTPYVNGWRNYRRLQQMENWRRLYSFIYRNTETQEGQKLAHKMSGLMLSGSPLALLQLCVLCMRHRKTIYHNGRAKGVMGMVRGFFYPFIFAFDNTSFSVR